MASCSNSIQAPASPREMVSRAFHRQMRDRYLHEIRARILDGDPNAIQRRLNLFTDVFKEVVTPQNQPQSPQEYRAYLVRIFKNHRPKTMKEMYFRSLSRIALGVIHPPIVGVTPPARSVRMLTIKQITEPFSIEIWQMIADEVINSANHWMELEGLGCACKTFHCTLFSSHELPIFLGRKAICQLGISGKYAVDLLCQTSKYPKELSLDLMETSVTAVDLGKLAQRRANFTTFRLNGQRMLPVSILSQILSHSSSLTTLEIAHVDHFGGELFSVLGRHCHKLRHFSYLGSRLICNHHLTALALGCPQLQYLYLCSLGRLTDQSLVALSISCPKLDSLTLIDCGYFSQWGLESFLAFRQNPLQFLNLLGCGRFPSGLINRLRNQYPLFVGTFESTED